MQNVYFFIGTKAQAIKCASLIKKMSTISNLNLIVINSGQHIQITENIIKTFDKNINHVFLNTNKQNINKYFSGAKWFLDILVNRIIFEKSIKKTQKNDLCIIHGDTASTLLGLFWSKKNRVKTIHLESGLTSNNILNPFPEEIIRNIVSKFSEILIASDKDSYERLKEKYTKKTIIQISQNTIFEEVKNINKSSLHSNSKIIVTLHRTENILSRKRFKNFVNLINFLSKDYEIDWYCHEPTLNSLNKFNFEIERSINIKTLVPHSEFLKVIAESIFVITDGGSIQEECFYLNKLTIIWRNRTERPHALNPNMLISNFDINKSINFIEKNSITDSVTNKIQSSPVDELIEKFRKLHILKTH